MALIHGLFDSGALSVAERMIQFTGRRHKLLAEDIANLSTPYFKPRDLDPRSFQDALAEAIDRRRGTALPTRGPLHIRDTRQLRFETDRIDVRPDPSNQNILFHDQNNRDLERIMQRLAENTMAHRVGLEITRNQFEMLTLAIRDRL